MDLAASDYLGPTLSAVGLNRVLAALVTRLSVHQSISQDDASVQIAVRTRLSDEVLALALDGAVTRVPGIAGGRTEAVTRWLDDARLETRQSLAEDASLRPDDASADVFVTVRSLQDGGASLHEECSVLRRGVPVAGAEARRILRRC